MSVKLTFGGMVQAGESITRYLPKEITILPPRDFRQADLIYWIYGPGPSWLYFWPKRFGKKPIILIHWVGSDVLTLTQKMTSRSLRNRLYYYFWKRACEKNSSQKQLFHICVSDWIQDELTALGIRSVPLPISTIQPQILDNTNHNEQRSVDFLAYLPSVNFEFYGGEHIIRLAKLLPGRSFAILSNDSEAEKAGLASSFPPNMRMIPYMDANSVQKVYRDAKCLLRLTRHDGLSRCVLEALNVGMQVIWTQEYIHTIKVDFNDFDGIYQKAREMIDNWVPNLAGQEYIARHFNDETISQTYRKAFDPILGS